MTPTPSSPPSTNTHRSDTGTRSTFTEEAFRVLLRNRFSRRPTRVAVVPAEPVVDPLDATPDPATAWVCGLYFCALERLPTRLELLAGADGLRAGRVPEDLWQDLQPSKEPACGDEDDEEEQPGETNPPDGSEQHDESGRFDQAYVTGCYLAVLGRRPDVSGLEFHQALWASTASEQAVLDSLMASDEYKLQLRFPPPRSRLDLAIGEALQTVVLSETPEEGLTEELATEFSRGVPVVTLVGRLMGKDRRLRARIRTFFIGRQLAALVAIEARLRTLEQDTAAGRQWEWRVNRHTWEMVERMQGRVGETQAGLPAAPGLHQ
jgi:Domain of unknown function (DUF4214)